MYSNFEFVNPTEIEKRSFEIIESHLDGVHIPENQRDILKRVIHTTADFDYIENLKFSDDAVESAIEALKSGACIVTDTNMARAGINKRSANALGCEVCCFIADEDVARIAKENGVTRAIA